MSLCDHFPDLNTPTVAEIIGEAVQQQRTSPRDAFEALLDSVGNWRLKPDGQGPPTG